MKTKEKINNALSFLLSAVGESGNPKRKIRNLFYEIVIDGQSDVEPPKKLHTSMDVKGVITHKIVVDEQSDIKPKKRIHTLMSMEGIDESTIIEWLLQPEVRKQLFNYLAKKKSSLPKRKIDMDKMDNLLFAIGFLGISVDEEQMKKEILQIKEKVLNFLADYKKQRGGPPGYTSWFSRFAKDFDPTFVCKLETFFTKFVKNLFPKSSKEKESLSPFFAVIEEHCMRSFTSEFRKMIYLSKVYTLVGEKEKDFKDKNLFNFAIEFGLLNKKSIEWLEKYPRIFDYDIFFISTIASLFTFKEAVEKM